MIHHCRCAFALLVTPIAVGCTDRVMVLDAAAGPADASLDTATDAAVPADADAGVPADADAGVPTDAGVPADAGDPPALVSTDNTGSAFSPELAIDGSGNVIAVWYQSTGGRYDIWANRYTAATASWGTATLIENDNAGDAGLPHVAVDNGGNAITVWYQSDGTRNNVWANRYTAATASWGTATLIENDDAGDSYGPRVAVDDGGNATVVWYQSDGTRKNVWAKRYAAATASWGTATLIENGNAGDANLPRVAMDNGGNAIAVWYQSAGVRYDIWANRYAAATASWGTATLIEADDAGDAYGPQVTVDGGGNATAVWYEFDGARNNVWANRYTAATSSWGTATRIESDDAGDANGPQVTVDGNGNATAAWYQSDNEHYNVWANRYTAATASWGTATRIESGDRGDAFAPQVAVDDGGNVSAVWSRSEGTHNNTWANRYTAATASWGTPTLIETDNTGLATLPQVAVGGGTTIVVWYQFDGIRYDVWAMVYK